MISNEYNRKLLIFLEKIDSNYLGIYFSLFLHLIILLIAIGLPDFFKPKPISMPNIIPIEIINVAETTSIAKKEFNKNDKPSEKKLLKQKKFNSSENTEIKKIDVQEKPELLKKEIPDVVTKKEVAIKEKIITKKIEKPILEPIKNLENIESLNTPKIKPKLKPKPKKITNNSITDVQTNPKPQPKPKPDFSIASMLKDLRNETSNNVIEQSNSEEQKDINMSEEIEENENVTLSISEIDLLRQQLSSCWNAPAGAVIEKGMKVRISAKVRENRRVIENSVRILDTNIAISNAFYGPITESAMRTLLNPECIPLKLPQDKFNLWKNLTITFDYSIMKGYSE